MSYKKIFFAFMIIVAATVSCKTQKDVLVEPQKDLSGLWRISKVTRNAADITEWIDSAGFRLTLNKDNTYTLGNNNIPFLVSTDGTWKPDDPQYPYHLIFVPSNGADSVTGNIGTPVTLGNRSLNITFSPGCYKNVYIYTLEKIQ